MASALGFPSTPTLNQEYTVGTKVFKWNGTTWGIVGSDGGTLTQEQVQDYIAPLFNHASHTNLTASYNDVTNKILLSASGGSGGGTANLETTWWLGA
jgi:hypothetical protein